MRVKGFARRAVGLVITAGSVGLLGLALGGCGGPAGSVAGGDPDPVSTKIGNLLAFQSPNAPPNPNGPSRERVDCPIVQIEPGHAAVRVGGEDSAHVRYQIAIGDAARDCERVGNELRVRVGVETRTVLGPAGAPGTYTAPLRVSLRKVAGEQTIASKVYRVGGAVGSTGTAITSLIAEPLSAPYTTQHADEDYEVVLSLGEGGGEDKPSRHRRR
ncbi:MAG: hypothetical protein KGM42_17045 [Hyphomicrobiales bacterium]|nr:hypothetical protein [Hyphomicrobiales bacterium]